MEFIEAQAALYPDLAEQYGILGNLYEKKLWHQLSIALEEFLSNDKNLRFENMLHLYESFISTFEARLNQVKLASLVSLVSKKLNDPSLALQFLSKVLVSRKRLGTEAALCLDMDVLITKLHLGDTAAARSMMEAAKEQLSTIKSTESYIFSKYYKAATEYRKVVGPANEFYSAALLYLSYTSVEDLSSEERITLATDMALSSVTGDDIYNFGEVLATPILSCLKGTCNEWLLHLVESMNGGDVVHFNSMIEAHKSQYFAQPALANRHDVVKQKIALLSILNVAFERPSHDRQIPFSVIASRACIAIDQVEWLLMRAMSLGLIKGVIDEVDAIVNITWVQPRVLDKAQISMLSEQLNGWTEKVKQSLVTIEDQTAELF